jgi:hypothetical protein
MKTVIAALLVGLAFATLVARMAGATGLPTNPGAPGGSSSCAMSCLPPNCAGNSCPMQDRCLGGEECVLETRYNINGTMTKTCKIAGICTTEGPSDLPVIP